ncbi:MAG TPA: riboflavin biosynthesis protein RibF [Gemmatimonadales bacterium]
MQTVLTVGSFDGIHRGHRAVLRETCAHAMRAGWKSLLFTFVPHPLEVVNPPAAPPLLTLDHERREFFAQTEVDVVAFVPFTRELSQFTPEAFVQLLLERFGMRQLVIGHDHGFGRLRTGDAESLQALGANLGFGVTVVPPETIDGREVSSTLIRRAVAGGDLVTAARHLGRHYSMTGTVIRGAGRGRDIGYRTINIAEPDPRKLLPPDGVYAVQVEWADGASGAMMHLGPRPTFGEQRRSLEAHLFDARPELYGRDVKLSWIGRLRDVAAFPTVEALKQQLDEDVRHARRILGAVPPGGVTG